MNRQGKLYYVLMIALIGVFLSACSSQTKVKSDLHIKGAPKWVNKGSQALKDKGGRLFHGVGIANPMGDMSLQRDAADNRARAELARVLQSYMNVVSKDYLASQSTQSNPTGKASDANKTARTEQDVSRDIKNITKVNLRGAKIIGRWRHKKTNVIYSIAELDMKRMKKVIKETDGISPGLQSFINDNGDNIFDGVATSQK